jgi:hypothetical protein
MLSLKPGPSVPRHARHVALVVLLVTVAATGCSHETGPSLSVEVSGESLVPTSDVANAAAACCCRVRGSVRNTSSIAVDVFINFEVAGAAGPLGAALDWVPSIGPGEQSSFDAVGILAPCQQVTGLTPHHGLTGHFVGSSGGQ